MVFFSATSPDQITDLPAFNDFQLAIQSSLEGHSSEEEMLRIYQHLDTTLGQVLFYFCEQLHFRPVDPALEERASRIYARIDEIRDESALALKLTLAEEGEDAGLHLDAARESLQSLMQQFAELRREEESLPRFSELTWVHELCRVAVACRQGQLSEEHLVERLETSRDIHDRAVLTIPQIPPLIADRDAWKTIHTAMIAALKELGLGLERLEDYLEQQDAEVLDIALELCIEGARKLLEGYARLQELEENAPGRLCPKCAQENRSDATRCGACGAPFPRLADAAEQAAAEGDFCWPGHVEKLLAGLKRWSQGQASQAQVLELIASTRERFRHGGDYFQQLQAPAQVLSPEETRLFEETRTRLIGDAQAAVAGLDRLAEALAEGQPDLVNSSSEAFLVGVQGLLEGYTLGQQLLG